MTHEQEKCSEICEEKRPEKPTWQRVQSITLQSSAFRPGRVYATEKEMNDAVKNGTFELRKTMAIKNGRLFFMCYK